MTKKNPPGGYRPNSGRHQKYDEPTETIAFRVPVSRVPHIKSMIKTLLEGWQKHD